MKKRRWCAAILAGVMAMTTVTGCGSSSGSEDKDPLVVSSKDFTESQVLGEVYALAFEDAGIKVERKMNIGSSLIHDAIVNDEVDFYVGYTGYGSDNASWNGHDPGSTGMLRHSKKKLMKISGRSHGLTQTDIK